MQPTIGLGGQLCSSQLRKATGIHWDIVQLLFKAGADKDLADEEGNVMWRLLAISHGRSF